jgi:hypothetical protein
LLSFVDETRLLSFTDDEGIEEVDAPLGLRTDVPTLAAGNAGNYMVQVTREGVVASTPGSAPISWAPDAGKKVTVGFVGSDGVIVIGVEGDELGGELVALKVTESALKLLAFVYLLCIYLVVINSRN